MHAEAAAAPVKAAAPVRVSKAGYVGVTTGDVAAMVAYYTDVLQFALVEQGPQASYLTTGPDHHCVVIEPGAPHGRARVGLQIYGALGDAEARLRDAGVPVERRTDPEPGVAADLVVDEPSTGTPVHLFEGASASGEAPVFGTRPTKLGHIAAYVEDLAAVQRFYEDVLGFRWADTIGDFFVFLRCNTDHHAMNFMQSSKRSGLHHVAYEMRDFIHLKDALDHLASRGVRLEWGPGRHGAGHNIFTYHQDPDGNLVELFTEIDVMFDEETGVYEPRPWHEDRPQRPKVWPLDPASANAWGPINPAMLDH